MSSAFQHKPAATTRSMAWAIICFLVLPITTLFAVSLSDRSYLSLPSESLSLRNYQHLFASPQWLSSIWQSFVIACASTAIAGCLGTLAAVGCWRISSALANTVRLAMLIPMMLPPIIYALGAYQVWADFGWVNTYTGIIVAHSATGIPYVVITVSTSLASLDPRLEQAARNLGAGIGQSLRYVILPNIKPGIVSGLVFAFIHSWDEVVVVLFIAGRTVFTLPRKMWDGINEQLDPTMSAVASLLILLTFILLALDLILRKKKR